MQTSSGGYEPDVNASREAAASHSVLVAYPLASKRELILSPCQAVLALANGNLFGIHALW